MKSVFQPCRAQQWSMWMLLWALVLNIQAADGHAISAAVTETGEWSDLRLEWKGAVPGDFIVVSIEHNSAIDEPREVHEDAEELYGMLLVRRADDDRETTVRFHRQALRRSLQTDTLAITAYLANRVMLYSLKGPRDVKGGWRVATEIEFPRASVPATVRFLRAFGEENTFPTVTPLDLGRDTPPVHQVLVPLVNVLAKTTTKG